MSFWANKLNGGSYTPPASPPRGLYQANYPQPVHSPQTVPTGPQAPPVGPQYTPSVKMTQGSTCPDCGSTNYMGLIRNAAVACPDCGYHPLFQQSGHGMRSLGTDAGQATPARQPANTSNLAASIAVLNAGGGERVQ